MEGKQSEISETVSETPGSNLGCETKMGTPHGQGQQESVRHHMGKTGMRHYLGSHP